MAKPLGQLRAAQLVREETKQKLKRERTKQLKRWNKALPLMQARQPKILKEQTRKRLVRKLAGKYDKFVKTGIFAVDMTAL